MDRVTKLKFQWSKVASVLGSYKDFIHAYSLSISSANFSQGQIESQLDTINRRFEQLKATLTGIATGVGASGLSKYIKNILSSLNAMAKAIQKIPSNVWKMVGAFTAGATAIGACVVVTKTFTDGMASLAAAQTAYRAAVDAGTLATERWAVATTAATGGLNILLAVVALAVTAFLGYNAIVSDSIKTSDDLAQKQKDNITAMEQQVGALERETEWIGTLCENHGKLQKALDESAEGTEQHKRAEEDLAATDQELAEIIGKDAASNIDWSKGWQAVMEEEKAKHNQKAQSLREDLVKAKNAQLAYTQNQINWTKDRIVALEKESRAWDALKTTIESFVNMLGSALMKIADFADAAKAALPRTGPIAALIGEFGGDIIDGAISSAREQGQTLQGWKAPNSIVAAFDNALSTTPGINIPWTLAKNYLDWQGENELEYQKQDLQKLEKEFNEQKADLINAKIDALRNEPDDSGVVPEKEEKGAKGKTPKTPKAPKEADNSDEAKAYRYLTGKGLDKNLVLGMLGNIFHESGFDPDATNGNHWGLVQWDETRWGTFLDSYLAQRGMSQEQYYASDKDTKSTLQLDYIVYELLQGAERGAYKAIMDESPSSPEQFAHFINEYYERSGVSSWPRQEKSREYAERMLNKNGEENYTDGVKAISTAYKEAKKLFDEELEKLKAERAKLGMGVSAVEEKALYEKAMFKDGKHMYGLDDNARKDYLKLVQQEAEYRIKAAKATKDATDKQVDAIDKMADAEVAWAEKLGLMSKMDVIKYNYQKNERNYANNRPILEAKLASTIDPSKGTAEDMLEAYKNLIYAKSALEAEFYATRVMYLSLNVDATSKTLGELMSMETAYQKRRQELEREAYEYKARYTIGFIDSVANNFQSNLEAMLNGTKSFGDGIRDIFKGIINDIIKMFTEDLAKRLRGWLGKALHLTDNEHSVGLNPSAILGGGKKGKSGGFDLMGWATGGGLSLLSGGKKGGKGGGVDFGIPSIVDALMPRNTMQIMQKRMNQMGNMMRTSWNNSLSQLNGVATTGFGNISTTMQTSTDAMGMTWENYTNQKVITNEVGDNAIIAQNQTTAATVQATTATMMSWLMLVLGLFALFGGSKKSKTSKSTSSENLGRAPESYYMTPMPVLQSTNYNVPSMDIGGNIERDMLIFAHKNEMVLTPEQADVIRSTARSGGTSLGNNGAGATVKSNIQVSTVDSKGFDRVLRDYNRDLSKQVKKGIRNGYLTAKGIL